jgi:hypothetical protein
VRKKKGDLYNNMPQNPEKRAVVDIKDISRAAKPFNTVPGDVDWNPHADITGLEPLVPDGKIDMKDIAIVAKHFGENYA